MYVFTSMGVCFRTRVVATVVAVVAVMPWTIPSAAEDPGTQPAGPAYVVVLEDSSTIPAKSKPLSAFGSFRFVDATGRTQVLPVSSVDLEATRMANAHVPDDPSKGTLSVAPGGANQPPSPAEEEQAAEEPPSLPSITVYSATWCGYCKDLKKIFSAKKIPANIIEVDRLPQDRRAAAEATIRRMTGRVSYPTVIIGGEAKAGFSKSWIESKIGR